MVCKIDCVNNMKADTATCEECLLTRNECACNILDVIRDILNRLVVIEKWLKIVPE